VHVVIVDVFIVDVFILYMQQNTRANVRFIVVKFKI